MAETPLIAPAIVNAYTDRIISRCRDLISYGLWSGLDRVSLDSWIANFQGDEERYLAATILDAMIYRSDAQTQALQRQMFMRKLPDRLREWFQNQHSQWLLDALRDSHDMRIRIVPVLPHNSPPTKSALVITRHLKRHLAINERWIEYPEVFLKTSPKQEIVIYVDDFLGTGEQFESFYLETGLAYETSVTHSLYAPLVAHTDGISHLAKIFPKLAVVPVEVLTPSHAVFDRSAGYFNDDVYPLQAAITLYEGILNSREIGVAQHNRFGFGALSLSFAFEHAAPDNSLPLLWYSHSSKWSPLFAR